MAVQQAGALAHLTSAEYVAGLILLAVWMAPDWGHKLLLLAEAIRRFRRDGAKWPYLTVARPGHA